MNAGSILKVAIVLTLTVLVVCPALARDQGIAVTVYNNDFGVVREVRDITVGMNGQVKFTDVAKAIDPTSVRFRSLTNPGTQLLEQNYQYDLLSTDKLLNRFIDRTIEVVAEGATYKGDLLSYDASQLILRSEDDQLTMIARDEHVRDIRFPSLPSGLLTRPTLVWQLAAERGERHTVEAAYITGGMNWHAEYNLVLSPDDTEADLSGWVSVENRSGKTYDDAAMKFVAGEVQRVEDRGRGMQMEMAMARAPMAAAPMEEKPFFEYHLYTLPRKTTLADNETKQLEMFNPVAGVRVDKKYLYFPQRPLGWGYGGRYIDPGFGADTGSKQVDVFVELKNTEDNDLGQPLPAGKVRVFKLDPDDEAMEFIGEERIEHTPKDETLELRIGSAFDVVGERRQVEFRQESRRNWVSETVEIKVRNRKEEDIAVRVKEPMYRWRSWEIARETAPHVKLDARTAAWDLAVPAGGEAVLTYTVEYTW